MMEKYTFLQSLDIYLVYIRINSTTGNVGIEILTVKWIHSALTNLSRQQNDLNLLELGKTGLSSTARAPSPAVIPNSKEQTSVNNS